MKIEFFLSAILISVIALCGVLVWRGEAFEVRAWQNPPEIKSSPSLVIDFNQPMIPRTVEKNVSVSPPADTSFHWEDTYRRLIITVDGRAGIYQVTVQGGMSFALTEAEEQDFSFTITGYQKEAESKITAAKLPEGKATEKSIEINLSSQRLTTWQDGKTLGTYLVSTGKPSTPTKAGVFEVLSKLPVAYGCGDGQCWKMPYWLGIYMVGSVENGIHELPFINGWREGSSSLGRGVSHGCVRLDIGPAEKVYNWTDIGIPINIHY